MYLDLPNASEVEMMNLDTLNLIPKPLTLKNLVASA